MTQNPQSKNSLNQSHLPILERKYPDISGTVLAFDFGEKRIGVAVGETLLKVAHPLTTIESETNDARFNCIANLIQEWRPSLLIVGLPTHMDGSEHLMTSLAKKFAQRLEGRFNLPVMMIDERLSSADAAQNLNAAGIKGIKQKALIDAVAAQTILQSHFDGLSN
ncbi:Holliday junction resolvase RuvX [Methylotenera versatilis]|uniref:Holliday junction resolvase RuvX n=1 Tax=Methylotenera versatilis TaxID=1055487 RepID=UPI0006469225|nr:Holliday junction resolvase RuvX [Methylotenera versatilis]